MQARSGGNADVGRSLYPLLDAAGFGAVRVSPRVVYVDGSRPHLVEGFMMTADEFDDGIRDLYRTAEHDGVFVYTFFKAIATR